MANKIILAVAVTAFLALTPQLSTAARHDAGRGNAVTEVCQTGSTAAKPFKGVWKAGVDFNEAVIELDFYGKSVNGWDDDGNDVKCYGTIHVGMGTNAYNYKVDDCVITAWKADGNKAEITFTGGRDGNALEVVRAGFSANSHDFITAVDENNVIVVKTLTETDESGEIKQAAANIAAYLENEGILNSRISYGTVVREIKEVSRSYKEAKMAMDVGKIFFDERMIIAYSELGIGRLIYQLPIPQCRMFIREIFGGKSPDDFDEETLTTINKFFENSLNVSETSRQLFIHRNTLVYRLDKLQKSTGLDLRVFEDAITFKIALMIVKYMKYMETFEY